MAASAVPTDWPKALHVGIGKLDENLAGLARLLDLLDVAAGSGDRPAISEILATFIELAEQHFAWEERLMRRHGDTQLAAHAGQHGELFEILSELVSDFESGRNAFDTGTSRFLKCWICSHVRDWDLPLVLLVREGDARPPALSGHDGSGGRDHGSRS